MDDKDLLFDNNDEIDKKINKDLKEIKEKLHNMTLSEEFKKKLRKRLEEELKK